MSIKPHYSLAWGHNAHLHPESPIRVGFYSYRCHMHEACCPYCGTKAEPHEDGIMQCTGCGKAYLVVLVHNYGWDSLALPCEPTKHRVFMSLYEFENKVMLVSHCLDCEKSVRCIELPYVSLKEMIDPTGVLDYSEPRLPTPVLDALRKGTCLKQAMHWHHEEYCHGAK